MSEASAAFMAGRLSTETCKCNSFNLDRIVGNDTGRRPFRSRRIRSPQAGIYSA
jgi:hypothetical protein